MASTWQLNALRLTLFVPLAQTSVVCCIARPQSSWFDTVVCCCSLSPFCIHSGQAGAEARAGQLTRTLISPATDSEILAAGDNQFRSWLDGCNCPSGACPSALPPFGDCLDIIAYWQKGPNSKLTGSSAAKLHACDDQPSPCLQGSADELHHTGCLGTVRTYVDSHKWAISALRRCVRSSEVLPVTMVSSRGRRQS